MPRGEELGQALVSPLGDQSPKADTRAEIAAFLSRRVPMREVEAKLVSIKENGGRNERSACAEAAGLHL
ncbi:hypothetical protein E5C30_06730 [Alcaligenes faecalis]|nr:hypothetical protein [Alcaligenes faecalis]MBY6391001.1 hypothetical protein [Alcaligenes faecalis]